MSAADHSGEFGRVTVSPGLAFLSTPQKPGYVAGGRIVVRAPLVRLPLLVHGMAGEVAVHGLDVLLSKLGLLGDLLGPMDADLGPSSVEFSTQLEALLGVRGHLLGGLEAVSHAVLFLPADTEAPNIQRHHGRYHHPLGINS